MRTSLATAVNHYLFSTLQLLVVTVNIHPGTNITSMLLWLETFLFTQSYPSVCFSLSLWYCGFYLGHVKNSSYNVMYCQSYFLKTRVNFLFLQLKHICQSCFCKLKWWYDSELFSVC